MRFGVFELDARAGELLRSGRRDALQLQPLEVLRALLISVVVSGLVFQTTYVHWVGDADNRANNRGGVCQPGDPRSRVGFGGCASFLVWPR